MKNEEVANAILNTPEQELPENFPEYTKQELEYLLNIIWDEQYNDGMCTAIRKALIMSCLRIQWFWKALCYQGKPVRWIFYCPYEDLPLLLNRRSKYMKIVSKWRLKIGK